MPIEGFRHKGLAELFTDGTTRRIRRDHHRKIVELLDILDAAVTVADLQGVSDFHRLKGARKSSCSMHVNRNYVLTFRFNNGDVSDVDYEDYH